MFKNGVASLTEGGRLTYETNPELFEYWARATNELAGDGKLPGKVLQDATPALRAILWTPGLQAARISTLSHRNIIGPGVPKAVRYKNAKDAGKIYAFFAVVLWLASRTDADVEDDPRSSDFAKIRVGYRRFDITGGMGAYMTLLARFLTRQSKSATTGKMTTVSPYVFPYRDQFDLLLKFERYKLAPVAGAAVSSVSGVDALGRPTDVYKEAFKLFEPLNPSEIYEAAERGGLEEAAIMGIPSTFGVGAAYFGDDDAEALEIKQQIEQSQKEAKYYEGNVFSEIIDRMVD